MAHQLLKGTGMDKQRLMVSSLFWRNTQTSTRPAGFRVGEKATGLQHSPRFSQIRFDADQHYPGEV
jgi:hypothetical protein